VLRLDAALTFARLDARAVPFPEASRASPQQGGVCHLLMASSLRYG
jgi:hypothetical protein